MRILLPTLDYPPAQGGVARYLAALVRELGSEVTVVTDGLVSTWLVPAWLPTLFLLWRRRRTYDLVLTSHVLPIGTAAWIMKRLTGRPYAVVLHGMDIGLALRSKRKRWLVKCVLREANVVASNSKALAEEVQQTFNVQNVVVAYPPLVHQVAVSKRDNFFAPIQLLSVSRLVERKGHLRVLKAIASLRKSDPSMMLHCTIVGDGPMEKRIRCAIAENNLGSIVTLRTKVSDEDLAKLYTNHDLFVLPVVRDRVDREGFGIVYLEAAAASMPSIATKMPGVDEAVLDGKTGILVEDGDEEGLVSTLFSLITDHQLRNRLGVAAHDRALTEFVPSLVFKDLIRRIHLAG